MLLSWTLCLLLPYVISQEVTENVDDIPNVTTLYPVAIRRDTNGSKVDPDVKGTRTEATVWKIDAVFRDPSATMMSQEGNVTASDTSPSPATKVNSSEEFRPSPHLGDFFDFESSEEKITSTKSYLPFPKKQPPKLKSSFQDYNSLFKKHPKAPPFPYKFESPTLLKARNSWKPNDGILGPKNPEAAEGVPAGGLYKLPDAFGEGSTLGDDGTDVQTSSGLYPDHKHHALKPRDAGWRRLVQLLTALVPAALLVSALTPSVITVDNAAPVPLYSRVRRSEAPVPQTAGQPPQQPPPPLGTARISERCRRRLLCELLSEKHYVQWPQQSARLTAQCSRYRCEDPPSVTRLLTWLLTASAQHQHQNTTPYGQ